MSNPVHHVLNEHQARTIVIDQRSGCAEYIITLYRGAQADVFVALTGDNTSLDLTVRMQGSQAGATVRGVYIARDKQQLRCVTRQEHVVPSSKSTVDIRGLVFDAARTYYEGTIFVSPEGAGTQAEQSNKNMLFGAAARARSVPSLEALTNDVRCAHGSAIGRIGEDQLLYLQSRGLGVKQAQNLLIQGFLNDVLLDLSDEALKAYLYGLLTN